MSSAANKVNRYLGLFEKKTILNSNYGSRLPEAYKKFWREWRETKPQPVHYTPEEGRFKRNPKTGVVTPVQNIAIPLKYPKEFDNMLLGGESLIKGFTKKSHYRRRDPKFWIPVLRRSVVYSEILNQHISVIVTERTIQLINDHYGFDHYLLKTLACDLQSSLALKLKRKLLENLQDNCPAYANDSVNQAEIMEKYRSYLAAYTPEEIEWYGLSFPEAVRKLLKIERKLNEPKPLKHIYRSQLIEKLRDAGIKEAMEKDAIEAKSSTWISKINPFTKKET